VFIVPVEDGFLLLGIVSLADPVPTFNTFTIIDESRTHSSTGFTYLPGVEPFAA